MQLNSTGSGAPDRNESVETKMGVLEDACEDVQHF